MARAACRWVTQIRHLQAAGARVSHLDTHKHTHMFPRVLRPLLRAAVSCGVPAVRNPFEPDWALKATPHAARLRRLQVHLLRTQRREFLKLVQKAGVATTDGAIGVLATGTLNSRALEALLTAIQAERVGVGMPSGLFRRRSEQYTNPPPRVTSHRTCRAPRKSSAVLKSAPGDRAHQLRTTHSLMLSRIPAKLCY